MGHHDLVLRSLASNMLLAQAFSLLTNIILGSSKCRFSIQKPANCPGQYTIVVSRLFCNFGMGRGPWASKLLVFYISWTCYGRQGNFSLVWGLLHQRKVLTKTSLRPEKILKYTGRGHFLVILGFEIYNLQDSETSVMILARLSRLYQDSNLCSMILI